MSDYLDALRCAMSLCAAQPNSIVMGQSVKAGGTALRRSLDHIPDDKLLELPVFENTQLGMATGMALAGMLPICCFPRWPFLLAATDQLVSHLDKLPLMGDCRPKVIVRVAVPTDSPMDPGVQHVGDHTAAFRMLLRTVQVCEMLDASEIAEGYHRAITEPGSWLMVEHSRLYGE